MGATPAAEPASPPLVSPQFRRQRSLASAIASHCCSTLCCYDCDHFFRPLPASSSSRELTISPRSQQNTQRPRTVAWHDSWRLLGSRRKAAAVSGPGGPYNVRAEANVDDDLYAKPTRWRLFCRKLRAGTRKISYSRPTSSSAGFQYDMLSYAMNFDEGGCSWQQQSLHRASCPPILETLPSSVSSVS